MANFITNSSETISVRMDDVVAVVIEEVVDPSAYLLFLRTTKARVYDIPPFETASTLEGIQGKAAIVLAILDD